MLIALVLANTLIDEPPLLRAQFDLAAVRVVEPIASMVVRRGRYVVKKPVLRSERNDGIQVQVRWKQIRVRMPIPSI